MIPQLILLKSQKGTKNERTHGSNHMSGYETCFLVSLNLGQHMEYYEQLNNVNESFK